MPTLTPTEYRAQLAAKPAAPNAAGTRKRKGQSPANALTAAILDLLTLEHCTVWRQNNGGVYDPTRQVFRAGSSTPGIADVLGYHRPSGRFVAVEVKAGKDKLSAAQTAFLAEVTAAGGFACVGRDVAQVRADFLHWRQQLPPEAETA